MVKHTMKIGLIVLTTLSFAAVPAIIGCDREISHEKKVEQKSDGTVKKEEKTVREKPDGTIETERTKSTDRP